MREIAMPSSLESERLILASLITYPELETVIDSIESDYFYHRNNQKLFVAISQLIQEGSVDPVLLDSKLSTAGITNSAEIIADILSNDRTKFIEPHIKRLSECYYRRKLITECQNLSIDAENEMVTIEDLQEKANLLSEIESITINKLTSVNECYDRMLSFFDSGFKDISMGMHPGWKQLGEHYRPAKGTLNIITGIPSHGKSEFMDALAVNLSLQHKWKWIVFSPENYPLELHVKKISEKLMGKRLQSMKRSRI